jgi:hypothetical protein
MTSHVLAQISVSGPLDDEELVKLRACLHDEINLEGGADPAVHGLYDYYETTKRLVDTVAARDADWRENVLINVEHAAEWRTTAENHEAEIKRLKRVAETTFDVHAAGLQHEAKKRLNVEAERDDLLNKLQLMRAVVGGVVADLENGDSLQARGELTGLLMDTGLSTPPEQVQRAWKEFENR